MARSRLSVISSKRKRCAQIRAISSVRHPGAPERVINAIACYRTKMLEHDVPHDAPQGVPSVRRATAADAESILKLVDALADYESLARPTSEAKKRLVTDMGKRFDAWIAELDGKSAGYAFVFETYSSFLALPTLYLEDLFVLPEFRSRKVGLALFSEVVEEAKRRGCGRVEWTVLDWNELAINFYKRAGAAHMKEWHLYRIVL